MIGLIKILSCVVFKFCPVTIFKLYINVCVDLGGRIYDKPNNKDFNGKIWMCPEYLTEDSMVNSISSH